MMEVDKKIKEKKALFSYWTIKQNHEMTRFRRRFDVWWYKIALRLLRN